MSTYPHATDDELVQLAKRFEEHGKHIYQGASSENSSPLYAYLSLQVARDPAVLALLAGADLSTTVTNLFFAAVHYLLHSYVQSPLAAYYSDFSPTPLPVEEAYPAFRAFCLEHADAIHGLVLTRHVQTNEVRRCAALFPAFCLFASRLQGRSLALLEIGSSAGLHLLWDRYGYDYGRGECMGDRFSPVQITCELRGDSVLPVVESMPVIIWRLGIDLNPIDVSDEDATRWLRALIWPEHGDRLHLLDAALSIAHAHPPRLFAGNAAETLPSVLASVPEHVALCVFHSYTLNQMPHSVRERILSCIADYSSSTRRELYRISQEGYSLTSPPKLELHTYRQGQMQTELLARCESHGRWLEWLQGM